MPLRTTATHEEIRAECHPFISVNMGPFPKLPEFLARLREKGSSQTTNGEEASRRLAGAAFTSHVQPQPTSCWAINNTPTRHVRTIIPVI